MGLVTRVQTLYEAVCISHRINTLRKSIMQIILIRNFCINSEFFNFDMTLDLREKKTKFRLVAIRLKIDLVRYPAHG